MTIDFQFLLCNVQKQGAFWQGSKCTYVCSYYYSTISNHFIYLEIIHSKLTIKTLEQGIKYLQSWRRSGVFIVNFQHISYLALVLLLLTLSR